MDNILPRTSTNRQGCKYKIDDFEIGDKVEANIKRIIPRADLIVHLDPDSEEDQIPWEPQYKIPPKA